MNIFPKPFYVKSGALRKTDLSVTAGAFDDAAAFFAVLIEDRFSEKVVFSENGDIKFERDASLEGGECKILSENDAITVFAADCEGAARGASALFQTIEKKGGFYAPLGEVRDKPLKPFRGVHMYMPSRENIGMFKRILNLMAAAGMNRLILEVGGAMEYESHPEINSGWEKFCRIARNEFPGTDRSYSLQWADSYWKNSVHTEVGGGSYLKKSEVRDLVQYAKGLGIHVIPELQALSHSYYMTVPHKEIAELCDDPFPDTYCPLNEESYKLYFDLAEEVLEVFEPETVSVGHDEIRVLGKCEKCRSKTGAELLSYELLRLYGFYSARGVRTAMWGESLQSFKTYLGGNVGKKSQSVNPYGAYHEIPQTHEALEELPRDMLMIDWYHSMGKESEKDFLSRGMKVIYGNFHGQLFGEWDERSKHEGVLGAEVSTWCTPDEESLSFDGILYEILYSAAVLREADYCNAKMHDTRKRVAEFIPLAKAILRGVPLPSENGSAELLWAPQSSDRLSAYINISQTALPDTGAARALGVFGDTAYGVSVDIPQPVISCGTYAKSLIFLAAAKETMPYRPTYMFPNKKSWELATAAIFYEDGDVALANQTYGRTLGALSYDFGIKRARSAGGEIDADMGGEACAVSPYFEENMPWLGSLIYETTAVCDGKTAAFAYEWINPYPDKKIVKIKLINACQKMGQSVVMFGIAAVR